MTWFANTAMSIWGSAKQGFAGLGSEAVGLEEGSKIGKLVGFATETLGKLSELREKEAAAKEAESIEEAHAAAIARAAGIEEEQHRKKLARLMGRQRALYGKSGLQMAGSPLEVMESTAREGEIDAFLIREKGRVEAGTRLLIARAYKRRAREYRRAGYIGLGKSLIGTIGEQETLFTSTRPRATVED